MLKWLLVASADRVTPSHLTLHCHLYSKLTSTLPLRVLVHQQSYSNILYNTMALKRKRSTPAFTSTASATTTTTAVDFFYTQSKPTPAEAIYQKPTWSFPTYSSTPSSPEAHHHVHGDSRLNSRTRKRHRDDRPDEESIYGASSASCWLGAVISMSTLADVCRCAASTISRLYEAQRSYPRAEPVLSQPTQSTTDTTTIAQHQKSTLHSFWEINSAPALPTSVRVQLDDAPNPSMTSIEALRCEDCDGSLRPEDAMDLDGGETTCHTCRRQVCDRCAVLGNVRVCLACATSRR